MSYTRSYSSSITVSGTKTVSYPASQYGGSKTVSFTETVPVNVSITVETSPFDNSVHNAEVNVDGLTASVATMNAANCAAIAQNAEKISQSLINGFYNLINNDIAMKKSENNSQLQAKIALLMELSNDTKDKHIRMEEDIERLSAHYGSIFRDLDSDLAKRIKEIDRPAFLLSDKIRGNIIYKPYLSMGAGTAGSIDSERQINGSIIIARIRHKVSKVLEAMSDSLHNNLHYRHMMKDTLWSTGVEEEQIVYIPVAYLISEDIGSKRMDAKFYVSDNGCTEQIVSSVRSYVNSRCDSNEKAICEEDMKLIDQAFSSMVEAEFINRDNTDIHDERVYSEMLRLWQNGKFSLKQI